MTLPSRGYIETVREKQQVADAAGPVTRVERVEPDLEGVARVLGISRGLTPGGAWELAVSGDTAARVAGTPFEELYFGTAELLAKAAAYGWWPKLGPDGDYVAVPLSQWIAEGHLFTPKVPNAQMMLARWGIQPVVIDATMNDDASPTAPPSSA
jgi:hypothetical protein